MLDLQSNGSLTFRAPAGLKSVTVGPSGQLVILDGKGSLWVTDRYERYEWRRLGSHTGPDAQTRRGSADGVGDWGYVDYVGDWIVTVVSDTRADPADKQVQLWDASGRVGPPRLLSDLLGRAGASPVDGGVFRDRLPNGNTGVWALRPSVPRAPPHFMEFKAVWHVDARWVLGEGLAADGPLQLCSAQRGDCRPAKAPAPDHVVFGIDASGSVIAWAPRSPEGRQRPGYRLASVQGHWIGPLRRREDIVWSARFIDADTVLVDGKSVDGKGGSFPLPDDVLHGTGARPPRAEGGPLLVVRRPQLVSLLRVDDGALQRMHEANRACLPVEVRAQWLGEAKPEACRAFAACEAGHGRERPPPPTCRDLPPEAPTTQAPPLDLERLRAGNQALQQQSAALLEQAEALRATVKTIEVQLEAAREAAK